MNITRRRLVGNLSAAAAVAAAVPLAPVLCAAAPGVAAPGGAETRLDEKEPAALALGYVQDADKVDAAKFPDYARGSNCGNCLQLQGAAGSDYRPCSLFPGRLVSIAGWCKSWTPEM